MPKFLIIFIISGTIVASCKGARLGEWCLYDRDCQNDTPGPHSTCHPGVIFLGTCKCKWMDDASGQTCIQPPGAIGDYCELERHCHYSLGHLSRCPEHECTCTDGSSPNENGTECVPNLKIGIDCIDGKCDCKEDSVPDFENNFCNPINETSSFS